MLPVGLKPTLGRVPVLNMVAHLQPCIFHHMAYVGLAHV